MRRAAIFGTAALLTVLNLGLLLLANLYDPLLALPWIITWVALVSVCLFYSRMLPIYVAQNVGFAWLLWRSFDVQEPSYGVAANLGFLAMLLVANALVFWLSKLIAPREMTHAETWLKG